MNNTAAFVKLETIIFLSIMLCLGITAYQTLKVLSYTQEAIYQVLK